VRREAVAEEDRDAALAEGHRVRADRDLLDEQRRHVRVTPQSAEHGAGNRPTRRIPPHRGFTAVAPAILRSVLGTPDPALSGAAVCSVFVASSVGQLALVPRLGRAALAAGCAALAGGMLLLAAGLWAESFAVLGAATLLAGLGQGVIFRAGLGALNAAAPLAQRAEVASTYFFVAYVALSLPVIGVGLAADACGLLPAAIGFSLAIAALAASALGLLQAGDRGFR
jgi:hypothetical protein